MQERDTEYPERVRTWGADSEGLIMTWCAFNVRRNLGTRAFPLFSAIRKASPAPGVESASLDSGAQRLSH